MLMIFGFCALNFAFKVLGCTFGFQESAEPLPRLPATERARERTAHNLKSEATSYGRIKHAY
jgi:hypothetical protein